MGDSYWSHLERAALWGTNLKRADLMRANFMGALLGEANLRRANLLGANLKMANLRDANLLKTHNLSIGQLSKARTVCGAHLDEDFLEQLERDYPHLLGRAECD